MDPGGPALHREDRHRFSTLQHKYNRTWHCIYCVRSEKAYLGGWVSSLVRTHQIISLHPIVRSTIPGQRMHSRNGWLPSLIVACNPNSPGQSPGAICAAPLQALHTPNLHRGHIICPAAVGWIHVEHDGCGQCTPSVFETASSFILFLNACISIPDNVPFLRVLIGISWPQHCGGEVDLS